MEARDRPIPEWFNRIRSGQVRLPRFQRHEAWDHEGVSGLVETVLRGLPAGAALVLEIGDVEPFVSRSMVGAPAPTNRAAEHLLDGQQRLTGLWRSLHDNYPDRTYFLYVDEDEDEPGRKVPVVEALSRWMKAGKRYPLWADVPEEVHARGYLPLRLLRPEDIAAEIDEWCEKAIGDDPRAILAQHKAINALRMKVASFNLPFLSLPVTTAKDVALDVFIKMNTSAVTLSAFDIVVAQVEEAAGQSLHDLVATLHPRAPGITAFADPASLVLSVAAMREDRPPTQASFQRLNLKKLVTDWDRIADGIAFAVTFLEEERVFDEDRLPTATVLPVLAALHDAVPASLDGRGAAKTHIRKYLWRSFLSSRYERSAGTRSLQDLRGLRSLLGETTTVPSPPVFDEAEYPLPEVDRLIRARWPKGKDIFARGVMAVCLRAGAHDLADDAQVSRAHLGSREYHHLFPDSLLTGDGELDDAESYRALNCALVTWNTNRNISAKEPLKYLEERAASAVLGEAQIEARLATHLVPFAELKVGGYAAENDLVKRQEKIRSDYSRFLAARAERVLEAVRKLWQGQA
jgi:hypothetical protein